MIEQYARAWPTYKDMECCPGLQSTDEDNDGLADELFAIALHAMKTFYPDKVAVKNRVMNYLQHYYPGKAFFCEVAVNDRGIQVYDPKGYVKERCNHGK